MKTSYHANGRSRLLRTKKSAPRIEPLENRIVLSTISWNNTASPNGGDWDTGSNWVGGVVPGSGDDVVIALNSGTVTMTAGNADSAKSLTLSASSSLELSSGSLAISNPSALAGNLTLDGGTLQGTVTLNGSTTLDYGTLSGSFTNNATMTLAPPVYTVGLDVLSGTLTNAGTVNFTTTNEFLGGENGATINNLAGAVFNFQADGGVSQGNFNGGSPTGVSAFYNAGLLEKTAGSNRSYFGFLLNDTGTVNVLSGQLYVGQGGIGTSNGSINVANGSNVFLEGQFSGTLSGGGSGTVELYQVFETLPSNPLTLNFSGSVLQISEVESGGFINKGNLQWTGGAIEAPFINQGTLNVLTGGYKSLSSMDNTGTVNINTADKLYSTDNNLTINNEAGGVFNFENDGSIDSLDAGNYGNFSNLTFNNAGLFEKTGGTGTSSIVWNFTNAATGIVDSESGTLSIRGVFTNFDSVTSTLIGGTYIAKGKLVLAYDSIINNQANLVLNGTSSNFITLNGTSALSSFKTNTSGGSFTVDGGRAFPASTFTNAGTLAIGSGSTFSTSTSYTQTGGATLLTGGTLSSGSQVVNINGGTLDGFGTVKGNVTNAGQVRPGGPGATGILNVSGNYAQTSAGTLAEEIGGTKPGTQYDLLNVSGTASLAGTLQIGTLNGYVPPAGASFRPLTFASRTGDFTTITGLDLGARFLVPSYDATGLNLIASPSAGVVSIKGTSGDDTIIASNLNGNLQVSVNGIVTNTGISLSSITQLNIDGDDGNDTIEMTGLTLNANLDGGTGANTLVVEGTAGADTFTINAGSIGYGGKTITGTGPITVNGVGGNDTFNITSANAAASLNGGNGNDLFKFSAGASITGSIAGGSGSNTIDESSVSTPVMVNLASNSISGVSGTFANVQAFTLGSGTGNTVTGPNTASTFNITGSNAGNVAGMTFNKAANFIGGFSNDVFKFSSGAILSGTVDGGGGSNTLDYSSFTTQVTLNLAASTSSRLTAPFANIQTVIAGTFNGNQLLGANGNSTYNITSTNAGNVNGLTFSNFGQIFGGGGNDTFVLSDGAGLANGLDAGLGSNWLDYGAYTSSVAVNLTTGSATGFGSAIANIRNVRGGSGNDTLTGNSQGNTLIGGPGNDTINGGSGRSVLIGGTGSDTINGGSSDDIVINGTTSYDAAFAALDSILSEWKSTGDSYATRISLIKNGGGLNGTNTLNWGTTVSDDNSADVLHGNAGNDWFFEGIGDSDDHQPGEQIR